VERKQDASPVTEFDRNAERAMREVIGLAFPAHAILGEEHGATEGHGVHQWLLDPIDGTISYTLGIPLWGTAIAMAEAGDVVVALDDLPALRERYTAAAGQGAMRNGTRVQCSQATRLGGASIALGDRSQFMSAGMEHSFFEVHTKVLRARTLPDVFGHSLVYGGHLDAMIDPDLKPWDIAAAKRLGVECGALVATRPSRREGTTDLVMGAPGVVEELLKWLGGDWQRATR
jgi:fructose-1,6-bisphosphatase/inositol monophosphatase family enzyme